MSAIDLGEGRNGWIRASKIPQFLSRFDWSKMTVVCHNAAFDGFILSYHYGVHPSRFICTLSMARALYPDERLSLEAFAQKFELGAKSVPYGEMDGVHPNNMSESLLKECGLGAANDCAVTMRLLRQLLADGFPRGELLIASLTVQMFTNPRLIGYVEMLNSLQQDELDKRTELLAALQASPKDIGSTIKFKALLEAQGVEVAMKPGKNGLIPAFAATDPFMQELLEADETTIRALAEARVAVKSNIRGTRAERLAAAAGRGALPVYLKYFGATRTGRWSGGDRVNWQNFPRSAELSECISAPLGHRLIICDMAQNLELCGGAVEHA
jgi:3'-5' exonuclease